MPYGYIYCWRKFVKKHFSQLVENTHIYYQHFKYLYLLPWPPGSDYNSFRFTYSHFLILYFGPFLYKPQTVSLASWSIAATMTSVLKIEFLSKFKSIGEASCFADGLTNTDDYPLSSYHYLYHVYRTTFPLSIFLVY